MRVVALATFACLVSFSGCLADSTEPTPPTEPTGPVAADGASAAGEPEVVFEQEFLDAYAYGSVARDFTLEKPASALQITVDFGTSAFVDFEFTSPEPCAGLSSGAGIYSNSASWIGKCGGLPPGDHTLGWVTRGTAQGRITVVAIP